MSTINYIILILTLIPLIGVITDLKHGKIKNYFIFPALIFVLILGAFIKGFYLDINNIIGIIIIIFLGYLFYKNNKWGAGDGKYIILLGISVIISGYLKGYGKNPLIELLMYTFTIFLIYSLVFLILNIKKIPFKSLKIQKKSIFDTLFKTASIYSIIQVISPFISQLKTYSYLGIFIIFLITLPHLKKIKYNLIKYIILIISLVLIIIKKDYNVLIMLLSFSFIFGILGEMLEIIFEDIDKSKIKLIEIKQGDILTQNAITKINKFTQIELQESPLQGLEVFEIIKIIKEKKLEKEEINIYNSIKIGIFFYIGYIIVILQII